MDTSSSRDETLFGGATQFVLLTNGEGRRSIWPADKPLPPGWSQIGSADTREACLRRIETAEVSQRHVGATSMQRVMRLSLMFFGDHEQPTAGDNKYDFLFECARFADREGFEAIWLPERHFTQFGCLFPSPAVLHAALARETKQIRLRSGSVVIPLHNPLRVAEAWSVVDNLSQGRVDLSFASGWHTDDFVLAPDSYEHRRHAMFDGIEMFQRLWRGEHVSATSGSGRTIEVRIFPTPVQPTVAIWLTAATNPETFVRAGELGFNVLTHLFDQRIDELADRIRQYRLARQQHGWDRGHVTVTLHTFIGETLDEVRRYAQQPYCNYLRSNFKLLKNLALSRGLDADLSRISPSHLDDVLNHIFEKFLGDRSLLGTPETCFELLEQLAQRGVNEVACLVDFGPDPQQICAHLPHLSELNCQAATLLIE